MTSWIWNTPAITHIHGLLGRAPRAPARRHAAAPPYEGPATFGERVVFVEAYESLPPDFPCEAWRDLAGRALEPNVFMEPDFAIPAATHLPIAQRPQFIVVWEGAAAEPRGRMIAILAIEPSRSVFKKRMALGWLHVHAALGAPLIDRAAARYALRALFDWVDRERPEWIGLALPQIVRAGPLFDALVESARDAARPWTVARSWERAVLRTGGAEAQDFDDTSGKHRREMRRKMRQLSTVGALAFVSYETPHAVREATEQFLALEHRGWKGARGTALLANICDATFTRAMTRLMARKGQCRIDALTLDGRPIAMGVLIFSGARGYFWKTAYDETMGAHSPGALLTQALIGAQRARPEIDMTDSCAVGNHPMIDRIWPHRQAMADLEICCDPRRAAAFHAAVRRRAAWRRARGVAKDTLRRMTGGKSGLVAWRKGALAHGLERVLKRS